MPVSLRSSAILAATTLLCVVGEAREPALNTVRPHRVSTLFDAPANTSEAKDPGMVARSYPSGYSSSDARGVAAVRVSRLRLRDTDPIHPLAVPETATEPLPRVERMGGRPDRRDEFEPLESVVLGTNQSAVEAVPSRVRLTEGVSSRPSIFLADRNVVLPDPNGDPGDETVPLPGPDGMDGTEELDGMDLEPEIDAPRVRHRLLQDTRVVDVRATIDTPSGQLVPEDYTDELGLVGPIWDNPDRVIAWMSDDCGPRNYVFCHEPLYFEDANLERMGCRRHRWIQPISSAAMFFGTIPILPYKMGVNLPRECVRSKPFLGPCQRYPWHENALPPASWRGAAFQAAATTGLIFIIP